MKTAEEHKARNREWLRKDKLKYPGKYAVKHKEWRLKNLPHQYAKHREWVKTNPVRALLSSSRKRAKDCGLVFTLTLADIIVPTHCPVLGIPLAFSGGLKHRSNTPSIDRFDNDLGYTPDNIRIISYRANHLKSDGSYDEMRKIVEYMEGLL